MHSDLEQFLEEATFSEFSSSKRSDLIIVGNLKKFSNAYSRSTSRVTA